METYTKLSSQICACLQSAEVPVSDFCELIKQSHSYVIESGLHAHRVLHEKYVELGKAKYGSEIFGQFLISQKLESLEIQFEKDPSDMSLVIRLAKEYALNGKNRRALQLLSRVYFSGYPERAKAFKLIQQLEANENHK